MTQLSLFKDIPTTDEKTRNPALASEQNQPSRAQSNRTPETPSGLTVRLPEYEAWYHPAYEDPLHAKMYVALLDQCPVEALHDVLDEVGPERARAAVETMRPPLVQGHSLKRTSGPSWGALNVIRGSSEEH